jgi:hypothetical protein
LSISFLSISISPFLFANASFVSPGIWINDGVGGGLCERFFKALPRS